MALCTRCGYILHDDDMKSHVCKPTEIPTKGHPLKPTTTAQLVE